MLPIFLHERAWACSFMIFTSLFERLSLSVIRIGHRARFDLLGALPFSTCASVTLLAGVFTLRTRSLSQYGDRQCGQVRGRSGFAGCQVCSHRLHSRVGR